MEPCRRRPAASSWGRGWSRWLPLVLLQPALRVTAAGLECKDAASCKARMATLVDRLGDMKDDMRGNQLTLEALEDLRTGILSGKRIELPSAQRQHLERGSPLIGEVSFDARHRPVSTNVSRHFKPMKTIASNLQVNLYGFLTLKKGAAGGSPNPKAGPASLLVLVDSASKLWIFDFDGGALLEGFDLGHQGPVAHLALPQNQEGNHFVATADDAGKIRVHNLKIVGKKDKGGDDDDVHKKQLSVSTNFSVQFSLPAGADGETRSLIALLPVDRGSQTSFVTADSLGGIGVFHRNGTFRGRIRVTEDPGGVQGLLRHQGQTILFYSSHSFGFFSTGQIDVQSPPCTGWNAPLFDVALDPTGSSSRVVLSLADGDIIVFSTSTGKGNKACDLTLKFPRVSALPLKLNTFKGHVLALPTAEPDMPHKADYLREIFFFNTQAMEAGYSLAPSRVVALQASFKPRQPESVALSASGAAAKAHVAIRFEGQKGLELFELSLKQPTKPKADGGGEGGNDLAGWLEWFPKIGVFGIALVGVVIWNVRKATSQTKQAGAAGASMELPDDLDEHLAKLRDRRRMQQVAKGGGADQGGQRGPEHPADVGGGDED